MATYTTDKIEFGGNVYNLKDANALPLSGGTLTNTDNVKYTVNAGDVIVPLPTSIIQSPVPKYLWHDILAFCRAATPTYYTTTDGTTWTEGTLNKRLFACQENWAGTQLINDSIAGSRFVWLNADFYTSLGRWLVFGVAYNANTPYFDVLLETSADSGSTWQTMLSVQGLRYTSQPIWIKIADSPHMQSSLRLTITRNSQSTSGAKLPICAIKCLSYRWGNQGKGSELEYPYQWNETPDILPIANNVSSLGNSSYKWKNIYATTFYGNVNGYTIEANVPAGGVQAVRSHNAVYNPNAGAYVGGSGAKTYARIKLPNLATIWAMVFMEVSIRGDYSNGRGGKVLINSYHSSNSPYTWTSLNATIIGNIAGYTNVYASDGQYFYVRLGTTYQTVSVDKVLIGDGAVNYDQSDITIDFVDSLPTTYQTATLYKYVLSGSNSGNSTTGISIANHGTSSITGVSGSVTGSHVKSGGNGTAPTLGTAFTVPNVTAKGSGSFTQGAFSGGSFTQGTDSFTANTPTVINTSKFSGGSFTRGTFSGGSGSFTSGAFSGGSGSFSATVSNHVMSFSHTHTAATHAADSHTHTAATHAADSFTAASLQSGFYTAGTAASFTQGTDSFTPATHGTDSHTHTAPTLGTAFTIPNVTSVGSASNWVFEDVTVPKAASATTVVTGASHTITDNGHTHTLS